MGKSISHQEEKFTPESSGTHLDLNPAPHPGIKSVVSGGTAATRPSARCYFMGIDGGGTKTQAIVMDQANQVLGEGASGASNPLRVGIDQAIENVVSAAVQAVHDAGLRMDQVTAAVAAERFLGIADQLVCRRLMAETSKRETSAL